jgi:type II secretory pathway component PulJ
VTRAEHIARHERLHQALDELAADFLQHHPSLGKRLVNTSILELLEWSHQQTIAPSELPHSENA